MGWFKKVGGSIKKFVNDPARAALAVGTFGFSEVGRQGIKALTPGAEGQSDAERQALSDAREGEADRRRRLLEALRRRSRVALGVQGGPRSLLFQTYLGTEKTLGGSTPLAGE